MGDKSTTVRAPLRDFLNESPYPKAVHAWYALAVLPLVYIFFFLDRQILNLLVDPVRRDLHRSVVSGFNMLSLPVLVVPIILMVADSAKASNPMPPEVVVCMELFPDPLMVAARAKMITSMIFDQIGVKLIWMDPGHCSKEKQPVWIKPSLHTSRDEVAGAFGYSLPFEGIHIKIFVDRVIEVGYCPPEFLLAYIQAHEIAHILEGTDQHAFTGIMKKRWSSGDFRDMTRYRLHFDPADIQSIQRGLPIRAETLRVQSLSDVNAELSRNTVPQLDSKQTHIAADIYSGRGKGQSVP